MIWNEESFLQKFDQIIGLLERMVNMSSGYDSKTNTGKDHRMDTSKKGMKSGPSKGKNPGPSKSYGKGKK